MASVNRFPSPLKLELQRDRKKWRLLAPFSYLPPGFGPVTAPAGYETDLASVRPVRTIGVTAILVGLLLASFLTAVGAALLAFGLGAILLYSAVVGYGQEAATIHDYLYSRRVCPRALADRLFRDALRSSGHARWRAELMWLGVRLGGAGRYGKGD